MNEILESKVNNIADVKLGLLLTEKEFLLSKLEMNHKAMECVLFLERYFSIVENREVVIKIESKEIDLSVTKQSRCCGRCDGVNDLCVADMVCDNHDVKGCEICFGKR